MSIQPGMMFGGEGPIMQGTWYNPRTGDAFTVRDSFFEDNQYVVTTTDGRYLQYSQLQNYVQSDMKLEDLKKMKNDVPQREEAIPAEISSLIDDETNTTQEDDYFGILPEDMDMINGGAYPTTKSLGNIHTTPKLGNIHAAPTAITPPIYESSINMNTAIIEKALKNTVKPDFSINVKWTDYPVKEIEMLKDIMDIPTEEIVEWYLNNIQLEDFVMAFKNAIDDKIRFGNQAECIEAKVIRLPEVIDIYTEDIVEPKSVKAVKSKAPKTSKSNTSKKKQPKLSD